MKVHGAVPEYPVVVLAVATAVILVAAPYLLRPARRLVYTALTVAAVGAAIAVVGLLDDIVGALALGSFVAAAFHLAIGSPSASPTLHGARAVGPARSRIPVEGCHAMIGPLDERRVDEVELTDRDQLDIVPVGRGRVTGAVCGNDHTEARHGCSPLARGISGIG